MSKNWFEIKNSADESAEVLIYDSIGAYGVSAKQFVDALKPHSGKHLNLRIHSPGGSVLDGYAIFSAIQRHPGGVTAHIDGIAASMATVIAMAASKVKMAANAWFMIHNVWSGVVGDHHEMQREAALIERMTNQSIGIYKAKTKKSEAVIKQWMDDETWFDANEAKKHGFVDEITGAVKAAASIDGTKFLKTPVGAVPLIQGFGQQATAKPLTGLARVQAAFAKQAVNQRRK